MVLANQNAKLTAPDQGFLVSRLVLTLKPWERGCFHLAGNLEKRETFDLGKWKHCLNYYKIAAAIYKIAAAIYKIAAAIYKIAAAIYKIKAIKIK
jgi:hypothetical protein